MNVHISIAALLMAATSEFHRQTTRFQDAATLLPASLRSLFMSTDHSAEQQPHFSPVEATVNLLERDFCDSGHKQGRTTASTIPSSLLEAAWGNLQSLAIDFVEEVKMTMSSPSRVEKIGLLLFLVVGGACTLRSLSRSRFFSFLCSAVLGQLAVTSLERAGFMDREESIASVDIRFWLCSLQCALFLLDVLQMRQQKYPTNEEGSAEAVVHAILPRNMVTFGQSPPRTPELFSHREYAFSGPEEGASTMSMPSHASQPALLEAPMVTPGQGTTSPRRQSASSTEPPSRASSSPDVRATLQSYTNDAGPPVSLDHLSISPEVAELHANNEYETQLSTWAPEETVSLPPGNTGTETFATETQETTANNDTQSGRKRTAASSLQEEPDAKKPRLLVNRDDM